MTSGDKDDDAEQRIQRAMDRIFSSPIQAASSCSSSPPTKSILERRVVTPLALERSPGEKNAGEKNAGEIASSSTPSCRPWDREDLLRRLGTFKSVSWFGKPSAAGPVACARRGWINVDMDLLCCEVCGSRLSFSFPATWSKKEVETAGLEFSRKLHDGHKTSCPWKGNGCGEDLAAFPPTPAPVLVQAYEARLQSVALLSDLPVISSSTVERMKISRGDQVASLLALPSNDATVRELEAAQGEAVQKLRQTYEAFLQAQKLISLCGWEVRLLPYAVDSHDSNVDSHELRVSLATGSDPCSAVLECRLCKASVGLWRFRTLSRSSLSITAILSTIEASAKKNVEVLPAGDVNAHVDDNAAENIDTVNAEATISKDNDAAAVDDSKKNPGLDLTLTIAGGPRPTRLSAPSPASIPIPGLNSQRHDDFQPRKSTLEQEPAEKTTVQDRSGSKRKRDLESAHRKKLKAVDGLPGSSSVNAVETSYNHNRHENSAESVECSPQGSDEEQDTVLSREKAASQEVAKEAAIFSGSPSEFDPVHHHRYFCPWISSNAADQSGKCGWQMTIDAIFSCAATNANSGVVSDRDKAAAVNKMDPLVSVRRMLGGKGKGVAVNGGAISMSRAGT
ncbi:hypothetical protein SELMODRAFT_414895 [Selaginella moellendorffii]|uniref:C3HC-type domain-containing protein n=1 Tax=Selaginella moellendorffii TaxID=88036 RepID=D8RTX8_SELML|nr:uncharacterized protein LOC9636716 [Selaginella moellendorffii]EFJ24310.1 hypothetical protein SELMODRAFT_414895 [Selaginella moellendorffii]|eukprot:XP_002974790.1 uncharacterized protein LOC9636716 [Selaginella moellendorffii]